MEILLSLIRRLREAPSLLRRPGCSDSCARPAPARQTRVAGARARPLTLRHPASLRPSHHIRVVSFVACDSPSRTVVRCYILVAICARMALPFTIPPCRPPLLARQREPASGVACFPRLRLSFYSDCLYSFLYLFVPFTASNFTSFDRAIFGSARWDGPRFSSF